MHLNLQKQYAKIISTKYDAMVDDNNQKIYNNEHDSIIIFRANEVLKEIGDAKMVDVNTISENYNQIATELKKKGENIKI